MTQAVAIQPGEVWQDDMGRLLAITRVEGGQTYYRINGATEEAWMRSHLFAWQLAKHKGQLVTLAPLTTY